MTDSMKLHNPFLIFIDTYYKTRIYSSRFFISRCRALSALSINILHLFGLDVVQIKIPPFRTIFHVKIPVDNCFRSIPKQRGDTSSRAII